MLESSSDEDGITQDDLERSLKKVKGKINILKMRNKLKSKRLVKSKIRDFGEMTKELEAKGISVNKDSLATRIRNPKTIAELEAAQDKKAKSALGIESGDSEDSDDEIIDDKELK